jgi:hypothetical protein
VYLWGCYSCFAFFLCVAFGIDGIPYLKRIGVVGLSLIVPFLIGFYTFNLKSVNRVSFLCAMLSLVSIAVTMVAALLNEFWAAAPRFALGLPTMVLVHGFMNAFLTIPCFFLAIRLEHAARLKPETHLH